MARWNIYYLNIYYLNIFLQLHFPLWARLICAKKPEHRSEAEMNKLVTLLRGMKSFGKFSRESQRNLCQTMTYAW